MTDHDFRQLPPTDAAPHPHKQGDTHNGSTHFYCNACAAHLELAVSDGTVEGYARGAPWGHYSYPEGPAKGVGAKRFPTCEGATAERIAQEQLAAIRAVEAERAEANRKAVVDAFFARHPPGWYWVREIPSEIGNSYTSGIQIMLLSESGWDFLGRGDDYDVLDFEDVEVIEGPLKEPGT